MKRRQHALADVCLVVILLLAIMAAGAPLFTTSDPLAQNLSMILQPVSSQHPLGTDELGRDLLTRLLYGSRFVFAIIPWVVLLPVGLGVPLGFLAGYSRAARHLVDPVIEVLQPLPELLLALLISSLLGPSLEHALLALSIAFVPVMARVVRSEVRQAAVSPWVRQLRAAGIPTRAVLMRVAKHILGPILVQCSMGMGLGVTATAGLGYLGLGAQPPTPEWGIMLNAATSNLSTRPLATIVIGSMIVSASLSFSLLGEAIQSMLSESRDKWWNPFLESNSSL
jgi:peptide/nickel transport system permease protein